MYIYLSIYIYIYIYTYMYTHTYIHIHTHMDSCSGDMLRIRGRALAGDVKTWLEQTRF